MTNLSLKFKTAFTLMELLVGVIIISVLAAFAIPNFERSIEKAHERNAITNLKSIAAAQFIFRTQNNSFYPIAPGFKYIADINPDLNLNITESGVSYVCVHIFTIHACQAQYPAAPAAASWTIQILDSWNWKPFCNSGACPTCKDMAGGGC